MINDWQLLLFSRQVGIQHGPVTVIKKVLHIVTRFGEWLRKDLRQG